MHDGFGAFQSAFGSLDFFTRNLGAELVGLEFLQTRHDNLGQVALLVTVRNLDGFIQLAFAQRAGNRRGERPGLFAGRTVRHQRSIMTPME